MASLFLKVLFTGICLIFLWLCCKKIVDLTYPLWNKRKSLKIFKDLINSKIVDSFIVQRSIKSYMLPLCREDHPFRKKKRKVRVKRRDLTKRLDLFLDEKVKCRNMLLLADSGMGKTCFALNYFIHNLKRPKKIQHKIVLVPLGLKNADKHILAPTDKRSSVLFLDGFDEDTKNCENPHDRLRQILELSQKYKKVIITSSNNFIPKDKNMEEKKGYERIGPKNINDDHYYEFRKLYFSPLTYLDIKKYVSTHFSFWEIGIKKRILTFVENNPRLRFNPFLMSYFNVIFQHETSLESLNDFYEAIIDNWVDHEPNWKEKEILHKFARQLAVDIYLQRKERGVEAIDQDALALKASEWGMTLYPMEKQNLPLISQNLSNEVKFTHRSIMEYLFIKQLVSGDKSCYQAVLTANMAKFLVETLENENPANLKMEFQWLTRFELKAHGKKIKSSDNNKPGQNHLFNMIIEEKQGFEFIGHLRKLLQNPIFYEFGWDPNLNENLINAMQHDKSSLMKLSKRNWTVMIKKNKIEITKKYQKNNTLLINEKDFKEYSNLPNNSLILKLGNAIGLQGLIMLNNINQSKNFCALPDLKTFRGFTLYFWIK